MSGKNFDGDLNSWTRTSGCFSSFRSREHRTRAKRQLIGLFNAEWGLKKVVIDLLRLDGNCQTCRKFGFCLKPLSDILSLHEEYKKFVCIVTVSSKMMITQKLVATASYSDKTLLSNVVKLAL